MNIGEVIKQNRISCGMTQEELGKRLVPPVQKSAVAKWENGRVDNIKRSHIVQMSRLFGIEPEDILCLRKSSDGLSKDEILLIERYRQLTEYDKGRLAAYLQMFLENDIYKKGSENIG